MVETMEYSVKWTKCISMPEIQIDLENMTWKTKESSSITPDEKTDSEIPLIITYGGYGVEDGG